MNISKKLLTFFLIVFPVFALAQSLSEAENYFNNRQFSKAKAIYESLLKKKPNDLLYNFRIGRCCFEIKDFESAVRYFESGGNRYPMRDLYLADAYFETYRFDQAITAYNNYLNTLDPNDKKIPDIQQKINQATLGDNLLNRVEDIAIVDSFIVPKNDFLKFYHLNKDAGTLQWEKIKLNPKSQTDRITYITQRGDRKILSDTTKGNLDILSSYKLLDNWIRPVSISSQINTSRNENYPFLLLDGVTLYFASDNNTSLGGYDIFITKYSPNAKDFLTPENIGFPFNSPYNDYMFAIDESNKIGWFASDRYLTAGKVTIYTFVVNDNKTYIRSEDSTLLRQYAQLKKIRKAPKASSYKLPVNSKTGQVDSRREIWFVINDSVVYTKKDQFKTPESLKNWETLNDLQDANSRNNFRLEQLRYQYVNTEETESRNKLGQSIIAIEEKQISIQKEIIQIEKKIRFLENKFNNKI
jgi:tetratricopeptide (TPR) repeat protein